MKLRALLTLSLPFLCLASSEAQFDVASPAQSKTSRRFRILVNGGYNAASRSFGSVTTFTQFLEEGRTSRNYEGGSGVVFEGGAIYSVTPSIGILGSFEIVSGNNDADFEKEVPHPLLFGQSRRVEGTLDGLTYSERAVHIDVVYSVERQAVTVDFFGGPTLFFTETEVLSDIATSSAYPFDDIALQTTSSRKLTDNRLGFNAGAALTYRLTPVFGISFQGRFSRATVTPQQEEESLELDAGGFRIGAGIRLAF